jgi:hypothetical protein
VSRTYRPVDFESFLGRTFGDSPSRRPERTGQGEIERSSRGRSSIERPNREPRRFRPNNSDRFRASFRNRDREYSLRESEIQTLIDIGRFRVVPTNDLASFGYQGDRSRMENDLQNLRRQHLVEQRDIEGLGGRSKNVLALTRDAHKLLTRQNWIPDGQAIYHGFVKPKEVRHDADLYRLYQQVAHEIEFSGGKVRRVVLDYELKRELYRKLARLDPDQKDYAFRRIDIASELYLHPVNDKIPVPDLRIEYEDECRNLERLDLEIATRDYRPQVRRYAGAVRPQYKYRP